MRVVQAASAAGMFTFLIRNIRVGNDVRFTRLLQHMKVRDIQATGGLTKAGFLSLCQMLFRKCYKYASCQDTAMFPVDLFSHCCTYVCMLIQTDRVLRGDYMNDRASL